jgi:hypothetical protein
MPALAEWCALQVGRAAPCAPLLREMNNGEMNNGAHGVP